MDKRERLKLDRQIRNSAGARVVLAQVEDGGKMQRLQATGLDGEVWDDIERPEEYGFTSHPLAGEAFVIFPNGDRSHPVVVALGDRNSRQGGLAPGEVKVYQANGDYVHLKNDNEVEVKTKRLVVNAEDEVEINTKRLVVNAENEVEINTKRLVANAADEAATNTNRFIVNSETAETNASAWAAVNAPFIYLLGVLAAAGQSGGDTTAFFEGSLETTRDITSQQKMHGRDDVLGAGVSLKGHTHLETNERETEPPKK